MFKWRTEEGLKYQNKQVNAAYSMVFEVLHQAHKKEVDSLKDNRLK